MTYLSTDTGGTFTDFIVLSSDGTLTTFKLPSTPSSPEQAIGEGLKAIGGKVDAFAHGTTVATNLVLERKGARTALIATKGFKDVIEIGRQTRPSLYEPVPRPAPLVPMALRFEVDERVDAKGSIIRSLSKVGAAKVVEAVKASGAQAVAVSLLFSFLDAKHETMIGDALRAEGLEVSLSSEVLPVFREYERTSTTVVDAYVKPRMANYIERMEALLPGSRILIMQSNGGVVRPSQVRKGPVTTLFSGPAGGVAATHHLSRTTGLKDLISFDMGGTSTDVSTIVDGKVQFTSEGHVAGLPVTVPMIDIITVGAGGGSLVWLDEAGGLKVGPESAGAEPGPVCYGRGGTVPTVTDCDLLAGIIDPANFLGGKMRLDRTAAKAAVARLAAEAGLEDDHLIKGAIAIVNSHMGRAVRVVTVERGLDPRAFTLVAFGGAGPMHAALLARELGISRVIVPFAAGVLSALGIMMADVRMDYSRTRPFMADGPSVVRDILEVQDDLLGLANTDLQEQGIGPAGAELVWSLDMRYKGQSYEVNVRCQRPVDLAATVSQFHRTHEERFTYRMEDRPVEVINIRLSTVHRLPSPPPPTFTGEGSREPTGRRPLLLEGGREADIHDWADLRPGHDGRGPAVIEEKGFTTLVPSGASWSMDRLGNIIIDLGHGGGSQ